MHQATLYNKLKHKTVKCTACSHYCTIAPDKTGVCGVRKNIDGDLFLLVYGWPVAVNIDPIEKKPLYHFLPGTRIFSLGTVGCNFACEFCQNWDISQTTKSNSQFDWESVSSTWAPEQIVEYCLKREIPSIAYTYNEPTIFAEYAYDTAKLAHAAGIKNVFVSNGYGSAECYALMEGLLDAANIDLKSFNPEYYTRVCHANIKPVLENIKRLYKMGIWIELTTLVVPGQNDALDEFKQIAEFIAKIDPDIPWHISRFFPQYKMSRTMATPVETLRQAQAIGRKAGLKYVYIGNCPNCQNESTVCSECRKTVIKRENYQIGQINITASGMCKFCEKNIKGIWK